MKGLIYTEVQKVLKERMQAAYPGAIVYIIIKSPKTTVVAEPTLLIIDNFKIEIPADISSTKITKLISVIIENI